MSLYLSIKAYYLDVWMDGFLCYEKLTILEVGGFLATLL